MRNSVLLLVLIGLTACSGPESTPENTLVVSTDGYASEPIPGTDLQRLFRTDGGGNILEEGLVRDSLRTGTWITYHANSRFPKATTTYVDGQANGLYMEFNERGQLKLQTYYRNNKLHGYWAKFRFGRPTMEANYVDGELDGVVREYNVGTGNLQKEITYDMGVMDGPYRFFNEEGVVTIEYLYRDGQKVSGGSINSSGDNEPR